MANFCVSSSLINNKNLWSQFLEDKVHIPHHGPSKLHQELGCCLPGCWSVRHGSHYHAITKIHQNLMKLNTSFFIKHSPGSCKRSIRSGLQNSCTDSSYQLRCHFCEESYSWGFVPCRIPWYHFFVVLICISLITNDVEHLFMCLYVTCIFSLVMSLVKLFPKLYLGIFFLNEFSTFYYVLWIQVFII